MLFGRHINRYYLKYAGWIIFGLLSLVAVDGMQLLVPQLYGTVVDGMSGKIDGFDLNYILDRICMPMVGIILTVAFGRFVWRYCFFGAGIRMEEDLRNRMFSHARNLSREYYQVNKVGDLMSLFTNDLDTVQECYGWGIMMMFDAVFQGVLALIQMFQMDALLTVFSFIPLLFLMAAATVVGKQLT